MCSLKIDVPSTWYDIEVDQKISVDNPIFELDNSRIYPPELMNLSKSSLVDIPSDVIDKYREYRPTPLKRARNLEKQLNSKCRIYYKYEGDNPVGSHKLNTALPQAYYTKLNGYQGITTATGAGQWGSAVAYSSYKYGIKCTIFFVAVSQKQKPYRKILMEMLGASVYSSPSTLTEIGRKKLADSTALNGSMGLATSEAIEFALNNSSSFGETMHARGVIIHQTVIGLECIDQMNAIGDFPDIVIGCVGGGTNFGGISTPFLKYKMEKKRELRFIAVEPEANPKLTKGSYRFDYADAGRYAPQIKMYTLGHESTPDPIHAGGLRYHCFDPLLSKLYHQGYIEAQSYNQKEIFSAGELFFKTEGILPAPESSHAIRSAIYESQKNENNGKAILFCLSGHGHYDLSGYDFYMKELKD